MLASKTKIDWCDRTWNPVWGCTATCPYCYARRLAHRFGDDFTPKLKPKQLAARMPKEPSWIFVNSMSDVADWRREWLDAVLARVRENPQHDFLFLTKRPRCYEPWEDRAPENAWRGVTATDQPSLDRATAPMFRLTSMTFLSAEPLHGPLDGTVRIFDWVIVAPESGPRAEEMRPKREWVERIVDLCAESGVPLWMKGSLADVWGAPLIQQRPGIAVDGSAPSA